MWSRTAYLSGTPEFTPGFKWLSIFPSGTPEFTPGFKWLSSCYLKFSIKFCRSFLVLFLLAIGLSVLRFTASDYPFGIFKLWKLTNKIFYKHLSLVKISRQLSLVKIWRKLSLFKICRQLPLDGSKFNNCHWLIVANSHHWLKFTDNICHIA